MGVHLNLQENEREKFEQSLTRVLSWRGAETIGLSVGAVIPGTRRSRGVRAEKTSGEIETGRSELPVTLSEVGGTLVISTLSHLQMSRITK